MTLTIVMVAIPPAFDLSGEWSLYHAYKGESGEEFACMTISPATGNTTTITLTWVDPEGVTVETTGTGTLIGNNVYLQFNRCDNQVTVEGEGTTDGNTMSGTFTETGVCPDERPHSPFGTWRAVKGDCALPITNFIDLYPSNVNNNEVDITFNVNNSGTIDANNVRVVVLYSDGYTDNCMEFIVTVPAGGSVPLVAGLTYATTYYIWIDPDNTILESNEVNNVACTDPYCSSPPDPSICGG